LTFEDVNGQTSSYLYRTIGVLNSTFEDVNGQTSSYLYRKKKLICYSIW